MSEQFPAGHDCPYHQLASEFSRRFEGAKAERDAERARADAFLAREVERLKTLVGSFYLDAGKET